jgi:hypothetical protein
MEVRGLIGAEAMIPPTTKGLLNLRKMWYRPVQWWVLGTIYLQIYQVNKQLYLSPVVIRQLF